MPIDVEHGVAVRKRADIHFLASFQKYRVYYIGYCHFCYPRSPY